jgi:hypothetical protein
VQCRYCFATLNYLALVGVTPRNARHDRVRSLAVQLRFEPIERRPISMIEQLGHITAAGLSRALLVLTGAVQTQCQTTSNHSEKSMTLNHKMVLTKRTPSVGASVRFKDATITEDEAMITMTVRQTLVDTLTCDPTPVHSGPVPNSQPTKQPRGWTRNGSEGARPSSPSDSARPESDRFRCAPTSRRALIADERAAHELMHAPAPQFRSSPPAEYAVRRYETRALGATKREPSPITMTNEWLARVCKCLAGFCRLAQRANHRSSASCGGARPSCLNGSDRTGERAPGRLIDEVGGVLEYSSTWLRS